MTIELKYSHVSDRFALFRNGECIKVLRSPYEAIAHIKVATRDAMGALMPLIRDIRDSSATTSNLDIPAPPGLEYMPFQRAAIAYASRRKNTLFAEVPGLGKTVITLGFCNFSGFKRLLVVCPASLRGLWRDEIEKWLIPIHSPGVQTIMPGVKEVSNRRSVIVSYDMAVGMNTEILKSGSYDLVVLDETHYLKNLEAQRTKVALGTVGQKSLISLAPRFVALTGTPIPNRVSEIYPILYRLNPAIIDRMSLSSFKAKYANTFIDGAGYERECGVKNEDELNARLRAGVMTRHLKEDVLTQLPPKRYKMVWLDKDGLITEILKKEQMFNAEEIVTRGISSGGAEIRHEMGRAIAPHAVEYVKDLLESGVKKVIVFAYHRDVIAMIGEALSGYGVSTVTGNTLPQARQDAVRLFQEGSNRVFLGNYIAAGTGLNLNISSDVVSVEPSYVPGENEQAWDRPHRIGQKGAVLIHLLLVQGSLNARILKIAMEKQEDINKVLR